MRRRPTRCRWLASYHDLMHKGSRMHEDDDANPWAWPTLILAAGFGVVGVLMLI